MKTVFKLSAIAAVAVALTACGGGGGGGSSAAAPACDAQLQQCSAVVGGESVKYRFNPANGEVAFELSFLQGVMVTRSVSNINNLTADQIGRLDKVVDWLKGQYPAMTGIRLGNTTFSLAQIDDIKNTIYNNSGDAGSVAYLKHDKNFTGVYLGTPDAKVISGSLGLHADVVAAHAEGWNGRGVSIAVVDGFSAGATSHGAKVQGIIAKNATGSTFTQYDIDAGIVDTVTGSEKVLNYSLGALTLVNNAVTCNVNANTCAYNNTATLAPTADNVTFANLLAEGAKLLPNAVVVKAAGNEANNAQLDVSNVKLNEAVGDRLIIVGALDKDGTIASKANLAWYSNKAGTLSDKFVVTSGCLTQTCASASNPEQGTSYAAPRVSSYAAIIQHKFQGLSAQNTAQIILNTARKDTINNYDPSVHGQGEASLSRALSPVGKLR